MINEPRDREVLELRGQGMGVAELSERFGVSRRTVFRIIETAAARRRKAGRAPISMFARRGQRTKEAQCA
jgi:hypothetical protein